MGLKGNGNDWVKVQSDDLECCGNLCPISPPFFAGDIGELIEDLNTDGPAFGQQVQGEVSPIRIEKGVDQNIGVKKTLHRSLASSRSNR